MPCYLSPMLPRQKIDALVTRFEAIDQRLSQPIDGETLVKLSRERAELAPVHEAIMELRTAERERLGLAALLDDPEMGTMAADEARALDGRIVALSDTVSKLLLPKDAADEKSAILEIRAGTGGNEAALFAGNLFR
ncbi:MAG: PCRF domain-containing protein, partial [Bauldia sp.]